MCVYTIQIISIFINNNNTSIQIYSVDPVTLEVLELMIQRWQKLEKVSNDLYIHNLCVLKRKYNAQVVRELSSQTRRKQSESRMAIKSPAEASVTYDLNKCYCI